MNETAKELRRSFLDFFGARQHRVVPSSPLVPVGDRTLLFTTAGMVQFKPFYGVEDPEYPRAASVQKCLRATDIDNVGHTIRHHTFLEMLGNFSFGDYFKQEAIAYAWEYVRDILDLPAERIWISVHESDDEAAGFWEAETDIPAGRIVRLGDKDNFWGPAGATGACGPSSEMYWDMGSDFDPGVADGDLVSGERYIEFWNLVFPQFDQQESGERVPLAHPGIDTGMGLERLSLICQGVHSTYETDLFRPIIAHILELCERSEVPAGDEKVAVQVIADHGRALAFAMADGVVPSNGGRGYVLRRLLRRAARRGRDLGVHGPFLYRVVRTIVEHYGDAYPELRQMSERVERMMRAEEERFGRTLDEGVRRFEAMLRELRGRGDDRLAGDDLFRLYDTFGFPVDLTIEMAAEHGVEVDVPGFERAMERQRQRAQAARQFEGTGGESGGGGSEWTVVSDGEHSLFRGYETLAVESTVRRFRPTPDAGPRSFELVLAETPFYAEAGGQVGDRGEIHEQGARFAVHDTVEIDGAIVHRGELLEGDIESLVGGTVTATVDAELRHATMRNHTATHLLHAALRDLLGEHVQQAGSLVAPDRLRFDFTHYEALGPEQIQRIEDRVNRAILANQRVESRLESYQEARDRGAMALFGEKYGREVRTIEVPGVSLELCGGTHCHGTGDIGLFKIVSESAIGAGMRRIEAVTGLGSLGFVRDLDARFTDLGEALGVAPRAVPERLSALLKEVQDLKAQLRAAQTGDLVREIEVGLAAAEDLNGRRLVVARLSVQTVDQLRKAGDAIRDRLKSGAAILAAVMNGKVNFLAVVTDDLITAGVLRADTLVREVAQVAGGTGGGKPHQALAGGKQVDKTDDALEHGRRFLRDCFASQIEQR